MAERDLSLLLSQMKPELYPQSFVFCTVAEDDFDMQRYAPLCFFRETEGLSLIVDQARADELKIEYTQTWALITCTVNSSLEAVGFLAAISNELANAGISLNPVAAFFHDHLFVPQAKAAEAMKLLQRLSQI